MECKYCGAQLDEGAKFCPTCGREADAQSTAEQPRMPELEVTPVTETEATAVEIEETAKVFAGETLQAEAAPKSKKLRVMMILAIAGCVILLGVLAGAILYGLGIELNLKPRANDIYFRDNYTVEDDKAAAKADVVIATAGNQQLTNSELQVYYWMTVSDFLNNYSYYLSYIGLDYTQPLSAQTCYFDPSMTWEQFLLNNAISSWHRYAALIENANAEGYEISDAVQEVVAALGDTVESIAEDSGYQNALQMLNTELGSGCTVDGYIGFWTDYYYGMECFNSVYDKLMPTDEEAEQYFIANEETLALNGITKDAGRYADVRHILLVPQGGTTDSTGTTTYTEAEWAACLAETEKIYEEWKKGAATEDSFAELANMYSKDPGSNTNGGLYQQIYPGQMVENFENWSLDPERQYGDHGIVESPYGYHIMYYVDGEDIWLSESRTALLSDRTTQLIEDYMAKWPAEVNYKKVVIGATSLG